MITCPHVLAAGLMPFMSKLLHVLERGFKFMSFAFQKCTTNSVCQCANQLVLTHLSKRYWQQLNSCMQDSWNATNPIVHGNTAL